MVEQVGEAVREEEVSLSTKPEYVGVIVGTVPPYSIVADEAVMVSAALKRSAVGPKDSV